MPKWSANLLRLATSSDETHRRFANMVPPQEPSSSSPSRSFSYICGLKNEGADRPLNPHPVTLDTVSHAMPGKYVIEYSVTDAAGNTNVCATAENTDNKCMRTVVVTDPSSQSFRSTSVARRSAHTRLRSWREVWRTLQITTWRTSPRQYRHQILSSRTLTPLALTRRHSRQ